MNIFTAAATGLAIVIKKIGIGFKAVLIGTKILIVSAINFVLNVITAVVNAILSAIKWVTTQIVNLIHLLFRTYLRLEAGCVPPVQKFAGLMIRLRWGFVIVSVLYAVYQYLGIKALVVAVAVCGGLVAIGYSEAEKEEEEWNVHLNKLNSIIEKYLKYLIRLAIMAFSVYSLHLMFHNNIATFSSAALLASVVIYTFLQFSRKETKIYENVHKSYFIENNYKASKEEYSIEYGEISSRYILIAIMIIYLCIAIGAFILPLF